MANTAETAKIQLKTAVTAAIEALTAKGDLPAGELRDFNIEVPADRKNGDFSANVAMVNAKVFRMPPAKAAAMSWRPWPRGTCASMPKWRRLQELLPEAATMPTSCSTSGGAAPTALTTARAKGERGFVSANRRTIHIGSARGSLVTTSQRSRG